MKTTIRNMQTTLLADNWGKLEKRTYEFLRTDESWETQVREVYDRGNGATILLYNSQKKTILLTRQFRIPTYLNGNTDGHMIETCAGKLDEVNPDECIIREVQEETGYVIPKVEKVFELYMSPGSVTEKIYFYTGEYDESMKRSEGGGLDSEQENIEVLEMSLSQAMELVKNGEIRDAKTIILLQHALLTKLV